MPYPTPEVGDAVTYVTNDGSTLYPAQIISVDGSGVATLSVQGPDGPFEVVGCAHKDTSKTGGSYGWPTGSGTYSSGAFSGTFAGQYSGNVSVQSGNSYVSSVSDTFIQFSDDAARTCSITIPASGTMVVVQDTSGSSTSGHTLTVSAASGTLHGNGVITPGTNKAAAFLSDGTDIWLLWKQ